jgi:hypothetical protein
VEAQIILNSAHMAVASRSSAASHSPSLGNEPSTGNADEEFLASVMVSVSASLKGMSEQEREQAVTAAEHAVAHLPIA